MITNIEELNRAYTLTKSVKSILNNMLDAAGSDEDDSTSIYYGLIDLCESAIQVQQKAIDKLLLNANIKSECETIASSALFATSSAPALIGPFYYPEPTTLGDRIHEARKALGLTQKQIAESCGVTASCVTQWEAGQITPSSDKIISLASALNCGLHWLLTGDGRPAPAENNQAEPTWKPDTLGDRIKSMRELRNLGQFYLASSIGVTRSCIEAWEENTTIPGCDRLMPLANALNCDPLWLLTGSGASQADALSHTTPQP
ncbi:helix-turn-helix domain-containing protein [Pantoea agglomerans]|uniref:helix-turn-helix domain-containing protein n=1 Tax=Enterobacter agglomerans TaxID=549 RepID=UPI00177EB00F|nr:helix-turn-helix domain-containing protein [Pantoea agglomerans]MBD8159204.1 helix-turn-helix domain-containing protein [Pantoea agglomerans]MBD8230286.1 helix-turn-helix domain-containing protein [Pantoea agglomerans]